MVPPNNDAMMQMTDDNADNNATTQTTMQTTGNDADN
jgi:hypothetical protein